MNSSLIEKSIFTTPYENERELEIILSQLKLESDNNNNNKNNLVFLGPSGVGKDAIINMLLKKYPEKFYKLPSYTTRAMRPNEKEGIDYFFITKEQFEIMKAENNLYAIQEYNNNFYASNKSKLNELINKGDKIIILNYNIETANNVKDEFDFNFIAILPPSEDELRNRLIKRGTKCEEIEKRMENSLKERNLINEANYIQFRAVNDEINTCFTKVENHIKKLFPHFFREI